MKTALRDPAATVTLAGTFTTAGLSLVSVTSAPPPGAALASATVACGWPCPWMLWGLTDSEFPPAPGEGDGLGDGEGEAVGDGEVPDPPPHWATASVRDPSARTV